MFFGLSRFSYSRPQLAQRISLTEFLPRSQPLRSLMISDMAHSTSHDEPTSSD
jgi:hypothetical protein